MDLVTLAEVKTELGISGTGDDTILATIISRASLSAQAYIGYNFDAVTKTEYYDGGDAEFFTLFPPSTDVGITVTDRVTSKVFTIDLRIDRHIILTEETDDGNKNIVITYPFGVAVANVPKDIKGVVTRWINKQYLDYKSGALFEQVAKTEKIQDLSITYLSPQEIQVAGIGGPDDFSILDGYKIKSYV